MIDKKKKGNEMITVIIHDDDHDQLNEMIAVVSM